MKIYRNSHSLILKMILLTLLVLPRYSNASDISNQISLGLDSDGSTRTSSIGFQQSFSNGKKESSKGSQKLEKPEVTARENSQSQNEDSDADSLSLGSWGINASRSATPAEGTSSALNSTYVAGDLNIDWGSWDFSVASNINQTKEVSYKSNFNSLGIGKTFKFDEDTENSSSPSVRIALTGASGKVEQEYNGVLIKRTFTMDQSKGILDISYDSGDWWAASYSYTNYSYSKNTSDLRNATNLTVLINRAGDLINTIGGLLSSSQEVNLHFYLGEEQDWTISFIGGRDKNLIDEAITNSVGLGVEYAISPSWKVSLGGIRYSSDTSTSQSANGELRFNF